MENNQLSGQEAIFGGQYGSTLQVVSGDSSEEHQKLVEFLVEEDDTSVTESKEEYEIANIEDEVETEGVNAIEAN
ncbi:unnamed protein product, partial [Brassica rapa subsp. trilocularis]